MSLELVKFAIAALKIRALPTGIGLDCILLRHTNRYDLNYLSQFFFSLPCGNHFEFFFSLIRLVV
jgi:hypothetical protein